MTYSKMQVILLLMRFFRTLRHKNINLQDISILDIKRMAEEEVMFYDKEQEDEDKVFSAY